MVKLCVRSFYNTVRSITQRVYHK